MPKGDWTSMRERAEWQCPKGCGERVWAHEIFNGCPPPPEPRECCGRLDSGVDDEVRACSKGRCQAWWCPCGTFTGMSTGSVMCGCEYDRGEVPTTRDDAAVAADDDLKN